MRFRETRDPSKASTFKTHVHEMWQDKSIDATQVVNLTGLNKVFVSKNAAWNLTASAHEALVERILRAIIVDRYFIDFASNMIDGLQHNAVTFDLNVCVGTAMVIYEVDLITTQVSMTTDLYSSLSRRR